MNKNEIFTLWIPNNNEHELPLLAHLSLKSMILCNHEVILYTYCYLDNVPQGVQVLDANEIIDSSNIFRYKSGHKTYSGFANLFRLKRLYEFGGTWLDLDVLLIRNINDKFDEDILICSEPTKIFYLKPNNAILRFPPQDPFVKSMLKYAEKRGSDIIHGETGPTLVSKTLKGHLYEYNKYLKNFNFNNLLRWNYLDDYSKSPKELLNNINTDEIVGFHLTNTFFEKLLTSKNSNGLFEILKRTILDSNSYEEYCNSLRQNGILRDYTPTIKKLVLNYLKTIKTSSSAKYTFLIDSRNLKKVEIYNIIHSIGYDSSFDDLMKGGHDSLSNKQIIIFGKTNLARDKVKFKENIIILPIDFNDIYPEIKDYIFGEYVIPLDKPIIFKHNFFIEETIENNVQYKTNNECSNVNFFNKQSFVQIALNENIFNFDNSKIPPLLSEIKNDCIFDYENRSKEAITLMKSIDELKEMPLNEISDSFLKVKHELMKLNFKNLIDEVSYHYFTSYENIINSSYYFEYVIKEENTRLKCLNEILLNRLSKYVV